LFSKNKYYKICILPALTLPILFASFYSRGFAKLYGLYHSY
jgi:hypothetical protein